jgi:hypothetical protein
MAYVMEKRGLRQAYVLPALEDVEDILGSS